MRRTYGGQLQALDDGLAALARLAARAVVDATRALVDDDARAGQSVLDGAGALRELQDELDSLAMDVLARQQPVAADLRVVIASLRMSGHLRRVGDYAVHLARTAQQRRLVDLARARVAEMGARAAALTSGAADVIESRDLEAARALLQDDDAVDRLNVELVESLLARPERYAAEQVVDVTLVGRYYERLADHAVAVGRSVSFIVTGAESDRLPVR